MRAPTRSLERRIEECLPEALRIIKPEEYPGWHAVFFRANYRKWQHVERCQAAVADAIRSLAATEHWPNPSTILDQIRSVERDLVKIDPTLAREQRAFGAKVAEALDVHGSRNDPPPGAELKPRRQRKKTPKAAEQKLRAVILAVDLIDDFSEPTMPGATVQSKHAVLARLLYAAATGDRRSDLRRQVREYFKEMVAPSLDQVRNRAGRRRSKRRDQRAKLEIDPAATIPENPDAERRMREWERPKRE